MSTIAIELTNLTILGKAFELAFKAHKDQTDLVGDPYLGHPFRVMLQFERGSSLAVTALLHDVLEDSDLTRKDMLQAGIPAHVIQLVEILTRRPGENYKEYIKSIGDSRSSPAIAVKLVDLQDNLIPERLMRLPEDKRQKLHCRYTGAYSYLKWRVINGR